MWIIINFKTNQFDTLKQEFQKKLKIKPNFFFPKLRFQKIKKNRLVSYTKPLLGNYIFCFHPKFNDENMLGNIKYLKGLKFFFKGFKTYQTDISNFMSRCKKHEDENGFIKQTFFNFTAVEKIKFLSGPFTNMIFKIIRQNKNSLEVFAGKINMSFSIKSYLFETV